MKLLHPPIVFQARIPEVVDQVGDPRGPSAKTRLLAQIPEGSRGAPRPDGIYDIPSSEGSAALFPRFSEEMHGRDPPPPQSIDRLVMRRRVCCTEESNKMAAARLHLLHFSCAVRRVRVLRVECSLRGICVFYELIHLETDGV
ncbi:unnamed protein product [Pleuronectes platessa]|uniref:Uncharacterized protein n=1 Tax=Pleuronectes platessa TaxID=8262 RepID=A0A9N7UGH3_PLEPL|nr:unnamed protein product [Pleuronectes platessa]